MKTIFSASQSLLKEFAQANSCQAISESKNCEILEFKNKKIVITSSCSSLSKGIISIGGYYCIPIEKYQEKSISYDENIIAVGKGEKERDYEGIFINSKLGKWVIIGKSFEIHSIKNTEITQLTLF